MIKEFKFQLNLVILGQKYLQDSAVAACLISAGSEKKSFQHNYYIIYVLVWDGWGKYDWIVWGNMRVILNWRLS